MQEKPKYNMAQCIGFMLKTAWGSRKSVPIICVVLAALRIGQSLLQLFVAPEVLSKVEQSAPISELLGTIGLFTLGLMLFAGIIRYIDNCSEWIMFTIRARVILPMLGDKAGATSYPNTLDPAAQKLFQAAGRTTNGNDGATENIWRTFTEILVNIGGFVIYLLMLQNLDFRLLIVILVTTVLSFFATRRAQRWEIAHRDESNRLMRQTNYIQEKVAAANLAKDIRIFGLKSWIDDIANGVWRAFDDWSKRRAWKFFAADVIDVILTVARNGIAYFVLINMALERGMPASEFLLYFAAVSGFTAWVSGIMKQFSTMRQECMELSHVLEWLNLPEQFRFEGGRAIPERRNGTYELRLENVSFRYPGAEKDTIHGMNLTIRPGEKMAIVGLNGAGKTTLVKLLCGFFDPTEGRVLLNGVDIREFNRNEYYELFSAVFQDFSVLNVSVAENVAQTVEDIDRERVKDCLKKAGLTAAITKLPNGLDSHVGREVYLDGVLFSGGETQRLMLARALYKDGPLLVLDEPTAALDPIAENDIYMKYNEMTAGKTSVFISHRLASTRFCDRIIFLSDGGIAEEGTHEELLKLGGGYAELFEIQSRYYREGRDF